MQKPESIVQIIHTHVLQFLHFSIDYADKTLCTHTIFTVKWKKNNTVNLKKSVHGLRPNVSNILVYEKIQMLLQIGDMKTPFICNQPHKF